MQLTPQDRKRFEAKVAPPDERGCHLWTASKTRGYGHIKIGDRLPYAHRVAYELYVGPIPDGLEIDHICHVLACVNPEHLRPVTPKQNMENRPRALRNSLTGIRGVGWHKTNRKWVARVRHHGKLHHLGYFDTIEEAEAAAMAGRRRMFTHSPECS